MTKIKPSLSKGTRDFLPSEVAKRNYIFNTIKTVLCKYGFEEIETPAIERLETLTGKYGEEGDKLLFKILNSGDYLKDVPKEELAAGNSQLATKYIAEKGLRYDLTVPLARYVVQHQDDLAFPFKRFHIGPVWRADRPQKGRYQEFYQCDADVIGSNSLLNEVELTKIYLEVFEKLGLAVTVQINHRKILSGIAHYWGVPDDKFSDFIIIIDKLDKIGYDGVVKEFQKAGFEFRGAESLDERGLVEFKEGLLKTSSDWESLFTKMNEEKFFNSETGKTGTYELKQILKHFRYGAHVAFHPFLARGLTYYTGTIWEVICKDVQMGSIASGGRYDNLTEMFGGQNMSGVGISFGIERIYDVMEELNLFPESISEGVKILLVPRDESVEEFAFQQTQLLRDAGIPAEIFLGNVKKQKHFNYVEQKNIGYIVEIGTNEADSKKFRLRNTRTRHTETDLTITDLISRLS
jgi:histidyl-tRNA synthetase